MYFFIFMLSMFIAFDTHANTLFAWSQVISHDNISIRVIIDDDNDCPAAVVDGKNLAMTTRAFSNSEIGFYEKVCEIILPRSTANVLVEGKAVPVLKDSISKVAIVGDTGCRVSSFYQQECRSLDEWPLAKVLNKVAEHEPDLVVHVGDYLYREKKCRDDKKCGKVYGDRFWTWKSDWFVPAKSLLAKSAFLFIRGNHESCNRSYKGWFRYFDEGQNINKALDDCNDFTDSWIFDLGKIKFQVFDSSSLGDLDFSVHQIDSIRKKFFAALNNKSKKDTWLLTHKPIWSYVYYGKDWKYGYYYGNLPQQKALGEDLMINDISHVLSGHAHIAQVLSIKGGPKQVLVGNSGSSLYGQENIEDKGNLKIGDFIINNVKSIKGFGFAIMEVNNNKLVFYNVDNEKMYEYDF